MTSPPKATSRTWDMRHGFIKKATFFFVKQKTAYEIASAASRMYERFCWSRMDSSESFNTRSSKHLWSCTTSSDCCRTDNPADADAAEAGLGWCRRNARLAVTARMEVPARPDSRRIVVADAASSEGPTSSTSKKAWLASRNSWAENEARP